MFFFFKDTNVRAVTTLTTAMANVGTAIIPPAADRNTDQIL